MKESLSYTFLLNIIILFISVCAAIVAGIFSYYRAFKANKIITNEIEKYEGYNCESQASIEKKLQSISYNVPFNAKCPKKKKDDTSYSGCVVDDEKNYAVLSYNLDYNLGSIAYASSSSGDKFGSMNSRYGGSGEYTHTYRFGVYTYMYIDVPILSNLFKFSIFSTTKNMHEFRQLTPTKLITDLNKPSKDSVTDGVVDLNAIPDEIQDNAFNVVYMALRLQKNSTQKQGQHFYEFGYDPDLFGNGKSDSSLLNFREAFQYYSGSDLAGALAFFKYGRFNCGHKFDWSAF